MASVLSPPRTLLNNSRFDWQMQHPMNPQGSKIGPFGSAVSWTDLWSKPDFADLFESSWRSLHEYVWLARNTESPKQYHLWSLLSLTSAVMSNHTWLNRGITGRLKLNLGIVLIGRPAVRKSSAIGFMHRFASDIHLNYGPTDTGGARHGIMTAMQSRWQDDIKDDSPDTPHSVEELGAATFDSIIARMGRPRTRASSIYFTSKELGRLLTAQTRELLDFFADGLDGESIYYQTKTGHVRIPAPLINLLGATTPGNLPAILPRDAHDHGLLSRIIFVYASKSAQAVPIPPAQTTREASIQARLIEQLLQVSQEAQGEINFSGEADEEYRRLYEYSIPTLEFRLNAYSGRRADHLAKVAGLLCLLRAESPYVVSRRDVGLAHSILALTELDMDAAYMGLGRSPEDKAYTLIREILESFDKKSLPRDLLQAHLSRGGYDNDDVTRILQRLINGQRLEVTNQGEVGLGQSIGREKLAIYLNELTKRIDESARTQPQSGE